MSSGPAANAALWYADDGFLPEKHGINGRRVAGASFLRGYAQHAVADELVALVGSDAEAGTFAEAVASVAPDRPVRSLSRHFPLRMAPLDTIFYPSPNFAPEVWRRVRHGAGAYSICGLTHTTASLGVMQGFFDLCTAPHGEWDAVICTSTTVRASVRAQVDLIDDYLARHLGATRPACFQTPVVPLGLDTAAFEPDPEAGANLRTQIGLGAGDVLLATLARLSPNVKFDPLPLYLAIADARQRVGDRRLHLAVCGVFDSGHAKRVFQDGAIALLGEGAVTFLDGALPQDRLATLSAADVFVFPIDNVQETFGLAPVEAMAAGLPVITSDWDGMRDTVTPEVGFRVPTRTLRAADAAEEALRLHAEIDNYPRYVGAVSGLTEVEVPALADRIVDLAVNPGLRRKMGAAGQARARALYDWAAVVPQMQAVFADLSARRQREGTGAIRLAADALPVAPSPFRLFAAWPSQQVDFARDRIVAVPGPGVAAIFAARDLKRIGRSVQTEAELTAVLQVVASGGAAGVTIADLTGATGLRPMMVRRAVIWLMKYALARRF